MKTITGSKVTFVGFGHIGKTTAKLLQTAFNVEVNVLKRTKCDPKEFKDVKVTSVYSFTDSDSASAFKDADYVVCSLPGTPETHNFIGKEEFKAMKNSAVFISIGRGVVVDEEALQDAITTNKIQGAALDVFHTEPLPKESPLWHLENVLISPHNADYTEDYFQLGHDIFLQNLDAYLKDGQLVTRVDKTVGY